MAIGDFLRAQQNDKTAPVERVGIGGFVALARVNESFTYSSESPTTYLEDGSSVEDHIILNAVQLSIEGDVSDLHVAAQEVQSLPAQGQSAIGKINTFFPESSPSQLSAADQLLGSFNDSVSEADRLIDSGAQVLREFGTANITSKPLQERFVDAMESLWEGKQLVDIEMPFRTFSQMRISNIELRRDNQRNLISFALTAQQIRFSEQAFSELSSALANPSAGLDGQADSEQDKGVQEGDPADRSLLNVVLGG